MQGKMNLLFINYILYNFACNYKSDDGRNEGGTAGNFALALPLLFAILLQIAVGRYGLFLGIDDFKLFNASF